MGNRHRRAFGRFGDRACAHRLATAAGLLLGWIALWPTYASAAHAPAWRLSAPERPAAGESGTYRLHGPAAMPFRLLAFGGGRPCPRRALPGDPDQLQQRDGYLDADGADVQQLSVASGRSTICVYNNRSATVVAGKVVLAVPGRDRLRITAVRQEATSGDNALITATGYVGRKGDAEYDPVVAEQHIGTVIVAAITGRRRCPTGSPEEYAPRTGSARVDATPFTEEITVYDAFETSRTPLFCAYLVASRRIGGGVRTRTVAHASLRISTGTSTVDEGEDVDIGLLVGGVLAWIVVCLLIAGIATVIRLVVRGAKPVGAVQSAGDVIPPSAGESVPNFGSAPSLPSRPASPQVPARPAVSAGDLPKPAEVRRSRAKPRDVIQGAVDAIADIYRPRLQTILEHQDGLDWLAELNRRRHASMTQDGKSPPRPYEWLEPRAVLSCLAYDPSGLQLISAAAARKARMLSGLVNDALHPKPHAPLTEADGYRAWQLFTDITGQAPPGDPFER